MTQPSSEPYELDYARIWPRINFEGPISEACGTRCWIWEGTRLRLGYPVLQVKLASGKWSSRRPYRIIYEALVRPIPDGYVIDHLCRNPPCCNPGHLEAVTFGENTRRGNAWATAAAKRRGKTHCKHGHEWTPENTKLVGNNRVCRACKREVSRRQNAKRRGATEEKT